MVRKIIIENKTTGEQLLFDETATNGFLLDSVEWDSPAITNESYRIPFQIGETLSSVVVGTRKPKITGYVVSNQNYSTGIGWGEYLSLQEQDIINLKNSMNAFFNIDDEFEIQVDKYYLRCRLNQPVSYSNSEKENNEVLCLFSLEFTCYSPLFFEQGGSASEFYHVDNKFYFPLTIPENKGVVMGAITILESDTVKNKGDVEVGFVAIMRVLNGTIINPVLRNATTGEEINVYDTVVMSKMETDDYIIINTKNGEEDVTFYDASTKETKELIGELSFDSTFFQLQKGDNVIEYDYDSSSTGQLEVIVYYDNQYFNIGVM